MIPPEERGQTALFLFGFLGAILLSANLFVFWLIFKFMTLFSGI